MLFFKKIFCLLLGKMTQKKQSRNKRYKRYRKVHKSLVHSSMGFYLCIDSCYNCLNQNLEHCQHPQVFFFSLPVGTPPDPAVSTNLIFFVCLFDHRLVLPVLKFKVNGTYNVLFCFWLFHSTLSLGFTYFMSVILSH